MTEHDPADTFRTGDDAPPAEPTDASFPWPPAGEPALSAWSRTWQGSALQPRRFFAAVPRTASLGPAVLYYLSIGIPVAGAALFWAVIRDATGLEREVRAGALGGSGAWSPLVEFLLSPVLLLLSLFLAAGITHLMLRLLGGAGGDYGLTTRVFAFAYSPQILGVIPVAGTIAGFIWMVVVAIIGLREAHRTSTGRAAAAVLIPVGIGLFLVGLIALMARAGALLEIPA